MQVPLLPAATEHAVEVHGVNQSVDALGDAVNWTDASYTLTDSIMTSIKAAACFCLVSIVSADKAPGERQAALLQRQIADAGETSAIAVFAAGCFWGVDLSFARLPGVLHTEVGYTGGEVEQPTYRHVIGGRTGHAEAVRVLYDPAQITYAELLDVFFDVHDASQLNRQGNDVGTQYRSAIFYATEEERAAAVAAIAAEGKRTGRSIATALEPATKFWAAEDYHQQVWCGWLLACPVHAEYPLAPAPPAWRQSMQSAYHPHTHRLTILPLLSI